MSNKTMRFAYATRLNSFKADAAAQWPGRNCITAPAIASAGRWRRGRMMES